MNTFGYAQKLGKALMLPIAVLPVAGLLMRLGQPDVLNMPFIAQSGGVFFDNIAVLFAIGVAAGLSKDDSSSAGLAGCIGYYVLTAALGTLDSSLNPGALAGIVIGITAAHLYNRFHNIRLPDFLGFFSGKRFVPIATGLASLAIAIAFSIIWPPLQAAINAVGEWMLTSGSAGTFTYGFANRLLIPFGLHHIVNTMVWFVFGEYNGATGELARFWAEDPTAGLMLGGFFPVMICGLPAAALAMYLAAKPKNKVAVGGALLSAAFTAALTGITEPLEYMFMFLAPVLYLVHSLLTGVSLVISQMLEIRLVFGFSGGLIDFVLNFNAPNANNAWMLIPMGGVMAAIYFFIFSAAIRIMDLKTPGRSDDEEHVKDEKTEISDLAADYMEALGGKSNLTDVDACITRLRLTVIDPSIVDEKRIHELGAKGVVRVGINNVQIILGPHAELVSSEMKLI